MVKIKREIENGQSLRKLSHHALLRSPLTTQQSISPYLHENTRCYLNQIQECEMFPSHHRYKHEDYHLNLADGDRGLNPDPRRILETVVLNNMILDLSWNFFF